MLCYDEYTKAKIFALPLKRETFGLVLVEALAQGCVVLTTEGVSSAKDIVTEENGIIIKAPTLALIELGLDNIVKTFVFNEENTDKIILSNQAKFSWKKLVRRLNGYLEGEVY